MYCLYSFLDIDDLMYTGYIYDYEVLVGLELGIHEPLIFRPRRPF